MNNPLFRRVGQNQFKLTESVIISDQTNSLLREAYEKDLAFLQEQLITEGIWDKLKQTVGGAVDKAGGKAKELLVKPLIKMIMDKVKKDDPTGFAKLQQMSKAGGVGKIMNSPAIKQKSDAIGKQLQTIQENMTLDEMDDFLQEYIDGVLEEARILKDDPRNVRRRELAAQRRAARNNPTSPATKASVSQTGSASAEGPAAKASVNQKGNARARNGGVAAANQTGDSKANVKPKRGGKPTEKPVPAPKRTPAPSPAPNKTPSPAPAPSPAPSPAPNKTPSPDQKEQPSKEDPSMLQKIKAGVGGMVSKVYSWIKANPKLTAGIAIALVAAIVTAVAMNSGSGENMVQSELEKSSTPEQPAAQQAAQPASQPAQNTSQKNPNDFLYPRDGSSEEKVSNALNYARLNRDRYISSMELEKIIGYTPQGSVANRNQQMLTWYKNGKIGDNELADWFKTLANRAPK